MLPKHGTLWNRVKKSNDIASTYCTICVLFRSIIVRTTHLAYALILILLLSCPAQAGEWTKQDTYREAAYLALHVIDASQTIYIAEHPEKYCEKNRLFFSEHPSKGEVYWKFAAGAVAHVAISYGLKKYAPDGWSEAFQWVTIGVEVGAVANNARIGIGFGF